jgi:hypothetical protein
MKKIKLSIVVGTLITTLVVGGILSTVDTVQAIGVSPPTVTVENVHRDIGVTKSIRVSRAVNEIGDIVLGASFEGVYAHHYVGEDSITIPADEMGVYYEFMIQPTDAAAGDYEGRVVFYMLPDEDAGEGNAKMFVIRGTAVDIVYAVTGEELLAYEARNVSASDTEVVEPLFVTYTVSNLGNVEWRPTQIELSFVDSDDASNIKVVDIDPEDIEVVGAGETNSYTIELDHGLTEAKYGITANFYYQGELFDTLDGRTVSIYPEGTLSQFCEFTSLTTNKETYELGEKIKLEALVNNTGDLSVSPVLYTEIYLGDELLDMLRGEEVDVSPKTEETLSEIVDLEQPGLYSFTSYVQYGSKKTSTQTVEIEVLPPPTAASWLNSTVGIIVLALLIIIIAVIIKLRRRKKMVPPQQQAAPPAAAPQPPATPAAQAPQAPVAPAPAPAPAPVEPAAPVPPPVPQAAPTTTPPAPAPAPQAPAVTPKAPAVEQPQTPPVEPKK